MLPEIAGKYAEAIGAIDNMTVVSADGTSKVAGDAMGNIKGLLEMAKDTVGIDLVGMLNGVVAGGAAGAAAGRASQPEPRRAAGLISAESAASFDRSADSIADSADSLAESAATAATAAGEATDSAAHAATEIADPGALGTQP